MAKNTLLATQNITTTLTPINETLSVYGATFYPTPFKFVVGETYTVVWHGTEYTCEAYDGGTLMAGTAYVGNASSFGMQGDPTQEFIIASNDMAVVVMSLVDTMAGTSGTHSVGVYYEDTEYKIFGSTLKAIANSIRLKTGTSEFLTPTAMAAAIESITGGGGGSSSSAAIVACGACGTNVVYSLTDDGTITITGNGAMANYTGSSGPNWEKSHSSFITNAVICDGVTHIGDWAFGRTSTLASVSIPQSVVSIGAYAFAYAYALETVIIPKSVTSIGNKAFQHSSLKSVVFEDPNGWKAGSINMAGKLDDPTEAAEYWKSYQGDYTWTKS